VPVSACDLELMRHIDEIHLKQPFWGSRNIRDELRGMGYKVGRGHVSTLIEEDGDHGPLSEAQPVKAASCP